MIITVTLNPAIDMWLTVPALEKGKFVRSEKERLNAGGKGVIIARILQKLNMGPVVASGILAGRTGLTLEDYLSREKVPANFVFLPGFDTRLNIEIVDSTDNSVTQINTTGPSVSEEHVQQLINNILRISHANDLAVLAGHVPMGLSEDAYVQIADALEKKGLRIVVNAGAQFVKSVLESTNDAGIVLDPKGPTGFQINSLDDEVELVKKYLKERPVLSFSWSNTENVIGMNGKIYHARIVNPNIRTLWGANSALTAGLVYGIHEGLASEETISLSMAMAYYVARDPWALFDNPNPFDEITKLRDSIEVRLI
ncbi:MAG TPA: uridylate kinase [Coprothermobacter sp.]|jgi:1-phosphofructokinase|nr:uridylate kinase [Coprothermobacter sp.]